MDEERSNGILRFLFKLIIVVIFILFIIWLLSLAVRKGNNSSNMNNGTTNNSKTSVSYQMNYQENLDRMKDAGISYYTLERLPKTVGDTKKLTLEEMYDSHLLLEIVDQDGKKCSSYDSYVEVTKLEKEYKMKVRLVCPKKDAYIIVYLGCYDYCQGLICEKQEGTPASSSSSSSAPKTSSSSKPSSSSQSNGTVTEYEYVKRTNGHWTDWSSWSKWQRNAVTESDTVKVQTKVITEDYTYEEEVENIVYADYTLKCPSGYAVNTNGNGRDCRRVTNETTELKCPELSGYEVIGNDGVNCTYKSTTSYNKVCPPTPSGFVKIDETGTTCVYRSTKAYDKICNPKSGYEVINNNGTTCTYQSTSSSPKECPDADSGYTYMSQSGNTCKYKSTHTEPKSCHSPGTGYTYVGMDGSKCVYKKYLKTEQGRSIPSNTSTRIYEYVSVELAQDCDTCGTYYLYTYKVYERKAVSKSCPSGYTDVDGTCHIVTTKQKICKAPKVEVSGACYTRTTAAAVCDSGQVEIEGICRIKKILNKVCPPGTELLTGICVKKATKPVTCPNNYELIGGTCKKVLYADYNKTCPKGYKLTNDNTKCYKKEIITVLKHGTRDVTLYRYATREYIGGTVDYKWSTSNHDANLLSQGYTLTGRTRQGGK